MLGSSPRARARARASARASARVLAVVAALTVVVAGVGWLALRWVFQPEVDQGLRDAATAAVDAYFERGPGLLTSGRLQIERPEARPRWFCAVDLIEVQERVRGRAVAGVLTSCAEFAEVGGKLLEGAAFRNAPMRVTMSVTDGQLRVRQVERVSDGAGFGPGVARLFSRAGADEVMRRQGTGPGTPTPLDQARRAFGLPASVQPERP